MLLQENALTRRCSFTKPHSAFVLAAMSTTVLSACGSGSSEPSTVSIPSQPAAVASPPASSATLPAATGLTSFSPAEIGAPRSKTVWVSGYNGGQFELINTSNQGSRWGVSALPLSPPSSQAMLKAASGAGQVQMTFLNGKVGWLAWADLAQPTVSVLSTTDGGLHWRTSRIAISAEATSVQQIDFANQQDGWLALESNGASGQSLKWIYHTANGGKTWAPVVQNSNRFSEGTSEHLVFTNAHDGWWLLSSPNQTGVFLYGSQNVGASWDRILIPAQGAHGGDRKRSRPHLFPVPTQSRHLNGGGRKHPQRGRYLFSRHLPHGQRGQKLDTCAAVSATLQHIRGRPILSQSHNSMGAVPAKPF